MDNPIPHIPPDVVRTLSDWGKFARTSTEHLSPASGYRLRMRQAGASADNLAQAGAAGAVVLVKPTITYAKVQFLLLAIEQVAGHESEVALVRSWLASCR